jgi:hypothetical protein
VPSAQEWEALSGFFAGLPDWRQRRGRYRLSRLVTLVVAALLSGVRRGQRDWAAFARALTPAQRAALRLPRRGNPRKYWVPSETPFFRLLSHLPPAALEKALLDWQNHGLGPRAPDDDLVAVDGKKLRHRQGVEIVSADAVQSGRWLGSERVAKGSHEIPAVQKLLRRAPLEGARVVADALHTQSETARIIVQDQGADYRLTVKGNQPTIADNVRQLQQGLPHAFSPAA